MIFRTAILQTIRKPAGRSSAICSLRTRTAVQTCSRNTRLFRLVLLFDSRIAGAVGAEFGIVKSTFVTQTSRSVLHSRTGASLSDVHASSQPNFKTLHLQTLEFLL